MLLNIIIGLSVLFLLVLILTPIYMYWTSSKNKENEE